MCDGAPAQRCTCLRNSANKDMKPGGVSEEGAPLYSRTQVHFCQVDQCECQDLRLVDPREEVRTNANKGHHVQGNN